EPRKFSVLATKVDAWNRTPNVPVGAVYLQRLPGNKVRALNVVCPHAGCFVDYKGDKNNFHCPCHNSSFGLDGTILDPKSPSPRPLDALEVEVRGNEVWVKFQNFRAGVHEKIPV
ncbi:MAG TPA: Rieske (2Fe-2S) protein, partial [Archangium sp.]